MKKRTISIILCISIFISILTVGAYPVSAAVKLLGTLTMKVGETKPLNFTDPSGKAVAVKWTSTDKSIATVTSSGKVTGKKAGSVVIKTKWNGKEYGVTIKVTGKASSKTTSKTTSKSKSKSTAKKTSKKTIALSKKSALLEKGKKLTLKLKNAKASKVKWSVKSKKIATVKKGVVTAKKAGSTTVTAKYKKKSYKCSVSVYAYKKLGSQSVTDEKNTAKIKGVQISFAPFALKKKAQTTLKKVSGLPKYGKSKMTAYDFSLKNAKVTKNDVAVLEIPYKAKKGKVPVAGYFNTKSQKWERVPCDYDGKNIRIIANHFSINGVGEADVSDYIIGKNTTTAFLISGWVPKAPTLTGEQAIQITAEAINSSTPTKSCVSIASDAVNQAFDYTVNWAGNLVQAFGFKGKFAKVMAEDGELFGALGFSLAFVNAVVYALKGEKYQAASTAYQGYFSYITGLGFSWIGTAAASAAAFATTFVSFALNKGYTDTLDANEKKWYDVFNTYYRRGGDGYRPVWIWRDTLAPILESADLTSSEKYSKVEDEVNKYAWELWNDPSKIAYVFGETQTKALKGGLNLQLEIKLSNQLKKRLYNDEIKKVYEWYRKKGLRDAQDAAQKMLDKFAEETEEAVHITFKDNEKASGKNSALKGWIVRWKNIPKRLTDKNRLKLKVKKDGTANTYYTLYAAIAYKIKPEVEICTPKGKVIDSFKMQYNQKFCTFNIMTAKVKAYLAKNTIKLNKTKLSLTEGDTFTLKLSNAKASAIKWKTTDSKIASVKGGKVTAKKKGTAAIKAVYKNKTYKCQVTVKSKSHYWKLVKTENYQGEDYKEKTFKNSTSSLHLSGYGSDGSFSVKHVFNFSRGDDESGVDHKGSCKNETYSAVCAMTAPASSYKGGEKANLTLSMAISHSEYFCSDFGWCNFYASLSSNSGGLGGFTSQQSETLGLTAWAPSGSTKTVNAVFTFPSENDEVKVGDKTVITAVLFGPDGYKTGDEDDVLKTVYTYEWV